MSVQLVSYLNFDGNAAEAMRYYQEVFGGELTIATFADFGVPGMPAEGTMHAALTTPDFTVMASDAMAGDAAKWGGARVFLAFMSDEADRLQGWFDRLGGDGVVNQPLTKQVWGDMYGALTDKFGLEWMFNISLLEGWSQS